MNAHASGCGCAACAAGCGEARPGPGLDALPFRTGTHASFLRAMQGRLSSPDRPALAALRTRDPADPIPALLDAGALLMDVLAFYNERILNEGYLRTATEAFSVEALARLVGYAPRPGVAASVHLAYLLDPGHADVPLPAGSRSQSVPAAGELPQTFETGDDLLAQAPLSAMRARLTRPPLVLSDRIESRNYVLKGLGTGLRPNDTLLFTFGSGPEAARALMDVHAVEPDAAHGLTRVTLVLHDPHPGVKAADDLVSALRQRLDGESLAELRLRPDMPSVQRLNGLVERYAAHPVEAERVTLQERLKDEGTLARQQGWKNVTALIQGLLGALEVQGTVSPPPAPRDESTVTRILSELRQPPSVQPDSALLLRRDARQLIGGASDSTPRLYAALYPELRPQLYAALARAGVAPQAALTNVAALRVGAGLFGATIPRSVVRPRRPVALKQAWADLLGLPVNADDEVDVPADFHPRVEVLALNGEYPQIEVNGWIGVERPAKPGLRFGEARTLSFHQVTQVDTLAVSADALSYAARVTVLTVRPAWLDLRENTSEWLADPRLLRETAVYAAAETLDLLPEEIRTPVGGDEIELDGLYRGLDSGRFVLVEGERDDLSVTRVRDAELAMIASVEHRLARTPDGLDWPDDTLHTFVRLAVPLAYRFRRDSLTLYGNVVRASHGETRSEVLGDGDSRVPGQTFTLKQGPLTYLPAVTQGGARSTLTVRVNGLRWQEAAPGEEEGGRRYTLETDAQGRTTVRFGERLPSGRENVTASYRSGLGRAGNVAAGQITLLLSKPLGVRGVVNPRAAGGGADREGRGEIRRNAPLATLALDRLVSVRDYEDFARTFAGVAKASARRFAGEGRPEVHLTVAGAADAPVTPEGDLARTLLAALKRYGDAGQAVRLAARVLRLLVVDAQVQIDPDWTWKDVEARLRATLLTHFGFGARELGQGVTQAEVLTTMQAVPGVVAVSLRVLDAVGEEELRPPQPLALALKAAVPAHAAREEGGQLQPAELLILTPDVPDTLVLGPRQGA